MTSRALALAALFALSAAVSPWAAQAQGGGDQSPEKAKPDSPEAGVKQAAPTVRIVRAKTDDGKIGEVCVGVTGGDGTEPRVVLTMDGVAQDSLPFDPSRNARGGGCPTAWDYRLPLAPGVQYLEATVYQGSDKTPAGSARDSLIGTRPSTGRLHIFTVGINRYPAGVDSLSYALSDARSFADSVRLQAWPLFDSVLVDALYDTRATRKSIDSTFRAIRDRVDTNDTFVFFFAGHGALVRGHLYLAGAGTRSLTNEDILRDEGIMDDQLITLLRDIPVRSKLMVLDACHSGQVIAAFTNKEKLGERAVHYMHSGIQYGFSSMAILAATDSSGLALESGQLRQGLFTRALLQGRAPGTARGIWMVGELKAAADAFLKTWYVRNRGESRQWAIARSPALDFELLVR